MSENTPAGAASAPAVFFVSEPVDTLTHRNPAVHRCLQTYERTLEAELEDDDVSEYECRQTARLAFRSALPDLIGIDSIRDFIACVSAGLAAEILSNSDATRLLYAAQVAIAAAPREIRPPGRPKRDPANEVQQDTVPTLPPPEPPALTSC